MLLLRSLKLTVQAEEDVAICHPTHLDAVEHSLAVSLVEHLADEQLIFRTVQAVAVVIAVVVGIHIHQPIIVLWRRETKDILGVL